MEAKDLVKYKNKRLEIGGELFFMEVNQPLFGEQTVSWQGTKHYIYATPNYNGLEGLSIEVYKKKNDELMDTDLWEGKIKNFQEYCDLIKMMTENIIQRVKKRKVVWGE